MKIVTFKFLLEFNWNADAPKINLSVPSTISTEANRLDEDVNKSNTELDNEPTDDLSQDPSDDTRKEMRVHASRDQAFVVNLDFLLTNHFDSSTQPDTQQLYESEDPETPNPRGFLSFIRNDTRYYIRKSSLLWMLDLSEIQKVSTDRLHRSSTRRKVIQMMILCAEISY